MNFDNSKRKVLKLQFRSFFVVVENSRAVKLLVKNDWLNLSMYKLMKCSQNRASKLKIWYVVKSRNYNNRCLLSRRLKNTR